MSTRTWQWKTWHAENAAVASVLLAVWLASGHKPVELLGSVAVFCGFCHASISERLREREAARAVPSVECHRKSVWFFCLKEGVLPRPGFLERVGRMRGLCVVPVVAQVVEDIPPDAPGGR